ncbi:MAG TPA: hypothetical protein VGB55_10065 [Tepidisphaeraceae bacterium]
MAVVCVAAVTLAGCVKGPRVLTPDQQVRIDRKAVEYPADLALAPYIEGLTAPTAIAFDNETPEYKGSILIAESGLGGHHPRIYGFKPDGSSIRIYPQRQELFFFTGSFRMYAPIGGMVVHDSKIYVSHRDANGMGVITAFGYDGSHQTIVADLPARGDFAVTDLALHPTNGRLYFGLGAATNSGVVGLDNWAQGWVDAYPDFYDSTLHNIRLNGYQFRTGNPRGGLFGGDDIAVTGPFQAFNALGRLRIPGSNVGKPTAAVYSLNVDGGDLRVEAHGIRVPRGLVFNEYGNLFVTNNGMELRGTRPVKDDPDSVLRVQLGGQIWYGWPDYTADLQPVGEQRFQPPQQMIIRTGYPELAAVVDHEGSGLIPPDRNASLRAVFPSLSGAAKMAFVGEQADPAFRPFRGSLIVALSGDRAPFATSGQPLIGPQGYRVMRVDLDAANKQTSATDFVFNTKRLPMSQVKGLSGLERPIDVKFGPDGALYILDFGRMEMKNGQPKVTAKTGRIFRLAPANPTTQPVAKAD